MSIMVIFETTCDLCGKVERVSFPYDPHCNITRPVVRQLGHRVLCAVCNDVVDKEIEESFNRVIAKAGVGDAADAERRRREREKVEDLVGRGVI